MEKDPKPATTGDVKSLSQKYKQVVAVSRQGVASLFRAPNLFNWFVGIMAIVLGFVFILSSPLITDFQTGRFSSWFAPLQVTFILGGLGLILSEMIEMTNNLWKVVFRLILASGFAALALIWWQGAEYDGVFISLWLAIVVLLNVIADFSSLRSYLVFYQGLFVGLPSVIYWLPVSSSLRQSILRLVGESPIFVGAWLVVIIIYLGLAWWGYFRDKQALSRLIGVASAPLVVLALVYANGSEWVRAFVFLVTAIFAFLLPFWDEFRFRQEEERQYVIRMFAVVVGMFVVTVVLIKVLQNILITNSSLVLSDKVTYGKILAEGTVVNAMNAQRSLAASPLFVRAMSTDRVTDLDDLTAGFFKSDRSLLRVVAVNSQGRIVSAYPLTAGLVGRDISSQDYFQKTVTDRVEVISDVIDSGIVDLLGRTVALTIPVVQNKVLVGALVGFLDLSTLSDSLSEIATPVNGEYFVILDNLGNWVVGPEGQSERRAGDVLVTTSTQKGILRQGYNQRGVLTLAAYQRLSVVDWQLILAQPLFTALAVNQTAYVVVLAVTSLSVLIIGLTVLLERRAEKKGTV